MKMKDLLITEYLTEKVKIRLKDPTGQLVLAPVEQMLSNHSVPGQW